MTGMAATVSKATAVLEFVTAMPGFPDARTWQIEGWGDDPSSPFSLLRNAEVDGLEFVVVSPFVFFPDYEPDIDSATVNALGIEGAEDVMVLVVLNIGESIEETTANLLGPIIINTRTNQASQTILHQGDLSTKARLIGD